MKFLWTTIKVTNMEASLKFYQEILGLPLNRRFGTGTDMEIAFLGEGGTEVELICNKGTEKVDFGTDISMGFQVESLDETMSLVKGKGYAITGPFQPNPHVKFFYTVDPDGMKIQFVENM
ncbi:MAG: Glyoxalase/bleomycin resistance protein/dioxygenase [Eubacterium sp.]|jgi:lactoylglutathione lyase|nr:Glyoxalase/bleomycin resistance protein/dioxygenase [Eubacterium sp.]